MRRSNTKQRHRNCWLSLLSRRVGSYRIIYEFNHDVLLITRVEKRDKIYQELKPLFLNVWFWCFVGLKNDALRTEAADISRATL